MKLLFPVFIFYFFLLLLKILLIFWALLFTLLQNFLRCLWNLFFQIYFLILSFDESYSECKDWFSQRYVYSAVYGYFLVPHFQWPVCSWDWLVSVDHQWCPVTAILARGLLYLVKLIYTRVHLPGRYPWETCLYLI